jgi:hypothetical protein
MKQSKAPVPADDPTRLKLVIGFSTMLAQSETVSKAFGPKLGFALIVLCVLSTVLLTIIGMIVTSGAVAGVLSRFLT